MKYTLLLFVVPAFLFAGNTPTGPSAKNTHEATEIVQDLRDAALQVNDDAAELEQLSAGDDAGWEAHSVKLQDLKDQINDMGRKLQRLKAIQDAALPWQKEVYQSAAPLVRLMADNATAAINYASANQSYLFNAKYATYHANLYKESKQLGDLLHKLEESAKTGPKS